MQSALRPNAALFATEYKNLRVYKFEVENYSENSFDANWD